MELKAPQGSTRTRAIRIKIILDGIERGIANTLAIWTELAMIILDGIESFSRLVLLFSAPL